MIYGDVPGFRAYALARGNNTPAIATDADAGAALQRASDYIRFFYVIKFVCAVPDEVVEQATYEAARAELSTPGFFSKTYTPGEAKVLTEVKGIRWTVIGNGTDAASMTPVSSTIEAMLGDYVARGRGLGLRSVG